jgi:hypothetical protein
MFSDAQKMISGALCLGSGSAKVHRKRDFLQVLDFAIRTLKSKDIFGKGLHKALGMLRSKYYPGFYLAFRCTGHHVDKIYYEFSVGMGYDSQVCIFAFGNFFADFYI